jgi:hypothetical protein
MSVNVFLHCIASVVSPTLLTASGAFISYKKWFDAHLITQIFKATLDIMLPIYLIFTVPQVYSRSDLWQVWPLLVCPLLIVPVLYLLGLLSVKLAGVPKNLIHSLTSIYSFASIGNIGILMVKNTCAPFGALYGESNCDKIIGYICMMWLPFNLIMYLLLLPGLRKDSGKDQEPFFPVFLQYFIVPVPVAAMAANLIGLIPGAYWFLYDKDSIGFMFTDSALLIGYCGIMFSQITVGSSISVDINNQVQISKGKIAWLVISRDLAVASVVLSFVVVFWNYGLFYGDKVMAFTVFIGLSAQPAFVLMSVMKDFGIQVEEVRKVVLWIYIISPVTLILEAYVFFLVI